MGSYRHPTGKVVQFATRYLRRSRPESGRERQRDPTLKLPLTGDPMRLTMMADLLEDLSKEYRQLASFMLGEARRMKMVQGYAPRSLDMLFGKQRGIVRMVNSRLNPYSRHDTKTIEEMNQAKSDSC